MKIFFKKAFLMLTALLVIASCSDDDSPPVSEVDKLPPPTHAGANTAGCLVNGKAFTQKGWFPGGTGINLFYQNQKYFGLSITQAKDIDENTGFPKLKSIGVFHMNETLQTDVSYLLSVNKGDSASVPYGYASYIGTDFPDFNTTNEVTGVLMITYHNFDKAIISGTFWFNAVNSLGDTVKVRKGRFDWKY